MKRLIIIFIVVSLVSIKAFNQCATTKGYNDLLPITKTESISDETKAHLSALHKKVEDYIGIRFNYRFYEDNNSHNAYASQKDTLYFGIGLIQDCLMHEEGLLALDFIFCHEAAHLYQFRDKNNNLKKLQKNTKNFELQADCLASKMIYDCLELRDANRFGKMLDFVFGIGDYFVNRYDHHGIPFERLISCFIYWNIRSKNKDITDFYNKSYYLFAREKCGDCHPISHNIIRLENPKGKIEFSIGFDMNLYKSGAENGFGNRKKIFGKIVPTPNSTIDSFVFKVDRGKFFFFPKHYYIKKGLIYGDKHYLNLVGALNPKD
jgi:hypothetical protein